MNKVYNKGELVKIHGAICAVFEDMGETVKVVFPNKSEVIYCKTEIEPWADKEKKMLHLAAYEHLMTPEQRKNFIKEVENAG